VERGGASEIVSLLEAGVPLVDKQEDLTPYQRQVILRELARRNEKEQEAMPDGAGGAPGAVNTLRQPGAGGGGGETVTYVNEHSATD
jgi:hypothetical protein